MPFDPTKPAPGDGLDAEPADTQPMNAPHHPGGTVSLARGLAVLLLLLHAIVQAQENPPPAPPAADAPAKTEMRKWIEATDAQWQAAFKRDVTDAREAEAKKLMLQYLTSLEDAIKKASLASDLDGAVALRNEQKRFGETQIFPEQDDAADAAAVKQIRTAIRGQLAKSDRETVTRAKALHTKYDLVLSQAQAQLTQRQRLDDALLVKAKRDEVSAAWLAGVPVAVAPAAVVEQPKPPVTLPVGTKAGPALAKVEAQDTVSTPLAVGSKIYSDRNNKITAIPQQFEGFNFTQCKVRAVTLHFTVLSDGLVYLACRSWMPGGKDNLSEEQLRQKGWHKQKDAEIIDDDGNHHWWVYSRTCRRGEKFSYRTEKYSAPILLVK
jgi:hypothetical protein